MYVSLVPSQASGSKGGLRDPLSTQDLRQIRSLRKVPGEVLREIRTIADGTLPVRLLRPCGQGDGINRLSTAEEVKFAKVFDQEASGRKVVKFVAASGAASRLFQAQRAFLQKPVLTRATLAAEASGGSVEAREVETFLDRLPDFAFFGALETLLKARGLEFQELRGNGQWQELLEFVLTPVGLGYDNLPKGLIPYHRYQACSRTAIEEHVIEAAGYARGGDGIVRVHFTVSPEHERLVRRHLAEARTRLPSSGLEYDITVSVQQRGTDTIAVDENGHPARDERGRLIFRPSGHGALLDNLNSLGADIVFLKTVDNALPDRLKGPACFYKRVLGGYLIVLEAKIHACLKALASRSFGPGDLRGMMEFTEKELCVRLPAAFGEMPSSEKAEVLYRKLNRPLRVCGVVRRGKDPGGAPFWVEGPDGTASLRIVEGAEVDHASGEQNRIWEACRYFNPVDIACSVRDFRGGSFHLPDFRDPRASFVVHRSIGCRPIQSLERPGLWNGGMAHWNSVFVEVPRITVHPVKRVVDLLSPCHQA